MALVRNTPDDSKFNRNAKLPFNLRIEDIKMAMQDVYDFFYDVNKFLLGRGLRRLDDTLRQAIMSGLISDMLTESVAKKSRNLVPNKRHNGHPDLLVAGVYPNDSTMHGDQGVEIKTTLKKGGAVDFHGARDQTLCVFVYEVDRLSEPATARAPMTFTEVYIASVVIADFRKNARGELGTRTATLHKNGIKKYRESWVYLLRGPKALAEAEAADPQGLGFGVKEDEEDEEKD
jgi:hypothetical protein